MVWFVLVADAYSRVCRRVPEWSWSCPESGPHLNSLFWPLYVSRSISVAGWWPGHDKWWLWCIIMGWHTDPPWENLFLNGVCRLLQEDTIACTIHWLGTIASFTWLHIQKGDSSIQDSCFLSLILTGSVRPGRLDQSEASKFVTCHSWPIRG